MADVQFHPEANAEYLAAWQWYHSRSLQAASRFELELERVLALIADHPDSFPKYDEGTSICLVAPIPLLPDL